MRQMHLVFSHVLTEGQKAEAKMQYGVDTFVPLPGSLQRQWSYVPPDVQSLDQYLTPIFEYLRQNIQHDDVVLVQGDFGATYAMVDFVHSLGATAVYATTQRDAAETHRGDRVYKKSIFRHIRFRTY